MRLAAEEDAAVAPLGDLPVDVQDEVFVVLLGDQVARLAVVGEHAVDDFPVLGVPGGVPPVGEVLAVEQRGEPRGGEFNLPGSSATSGHIGREEQGCGQKNDASHGILLR